MWPLVVVVVMLALVLVVLRGPPELARVVVRDGKPELSRGRLPGALMDDFADVLSRDAAEGAVVRVVSEGGRPRIVTRGLDEGQTQRLRNVLGPYSVAAIRQGRRTPHPSA